MRAINIIKCKSARTGFAAFIQYSTYVKLNYNKRNSPEDIVAIISTDQHNSLISGVPLYR